MSEAYATPDTALELRAEHWLEDHPASDPYVVGAAMLAAGVLVEGIVSLKTAVLFLALVCFVLSAAGVSSRVNLTALGLALWVATQLW